MHVYWADAAGIDQVREELTRAARFNPQPLKQSLSALEVVLKGLYPEGTLSRLVAWDGNWVLEDRSDRGAAEWLTQLAELVRSVLDAVDRR